jgi:two-component system NtrC family response regulator
MADGTFREDLYYRLAVVQVQLPPLRDRGDDANLLARTLLQQFATEVGKNGISFGAEALRAIRAYEWPGNVRELQNRVKRAVIMSSNRRVTAQDLELSSAGAANQQASLKEAREALERDMVKESLRKHGGKITAAAAELGVSRPTFYELMDKLGIPKPD